MISCSSDLRFSFASSFPLPLSSALSLPPRLLYGPLNMQIFSLVATMGLLRCSMVQSVGQIARWKAPRTPHDSQILACRSRQSRMEASIMIGNLKASSQRNQIAWRQLCSDIWSTRFVWMPKEAYRAGRRRYVQKFQGVRHQKKRRSPDPVSCKTEAACGHDRQR